MKIIQKCHTCRREHTLDFDPVFGPGSGFSDWLTKHPGHHVDFVYPRRSPKPLRAKTTLWPAFRLARRHFVSQEELRREEVRVYSGSWLSYLHNADVKVAYAASATPTITLASLAASSTLLAGRESTAIDNGASVKYLDYLAAGSYTADNTNNQAGTILTCVVGALNDTPTWPDQFDGTDSTETVSKAGVFNAVCRIISSIAADNTASQVWPFGPVAIAGAFGGVIPDQFVYFVTHNIQTTTNAWESSGQNLYHTPVYATVA